MPFNNPPREVPQAPVQDREPLLRAGGLYNSKSNSLTGNINLLYVDRDGNRFGDRLMAMIEEAMRRGVALRALVFESRPSFDGTAPRSPYMLNFGFGQPKPQADERTARVEAPSPPTADSRAWAREPDLDSEAGLPAPEPTPRRRTPPSRSGR